MNKLKKLSLYLFISSFIILLSGCDSNQTIVSQVEERDANIIVVFLSSKGIDAEKQQAAASGVIGGEGSSKPKFNILVDSSQALEAMAILNQNGLPRRQGTNLLELFAKQGLMSSDKEETIRYQAGLEQQIANTILLMDGVLDATVQLSFPKEETTLGVQTSEKVTASIYVKHQGVADDPNIHLENKIKRFVSGSVTNLSVNDVTVVSDRARIVDANPESATETMDHGSKEYVSIWSIVMSKQSTGKFRTIFFIITFLMVIFAVGFGWIVWKIYPILRRKGIKELLNPVPLMGENSSHKEETKENE